MKGRNIIWILLLFIVGIIPAYVSANSVEYVFDDAFFTGSYIPSLYVHADVHFNRGGNDFGGKMFFQDLKIIPTMTLSLSGDGEKNCNKQLRGFYINSTRGNRVRPLDEDSLAHLQSVNSGYNNMVMSGGLFICDTPSNTIVGYLQHTRKGEEYSLVVGMEYDFPGNRYLSAFDSNGTFTFDDDLVFGYIRDSYGGIANVIGSGLDVAYACGNGILENTEQCDDGVNNGTLNNCNLSCNGITTFVCGDAIIQTGDELCDEGTGLNGQPGHCNLACNGTIPSNPVTPPSGGGGGGVNCSHVDCSTTINSLCCTSQEELAVQEKKITQLLESTGFAIQNTGTCPVDNSPYSVEMTEAFSFAYSRNITNQCPITKANLNGRLLRKHAAKMISQFALTVLGKKPDSLAICEFNDMSNETPEMKYYTKLACKLGIMGLKADGTPDIKFTPNGEITRAQFGTMLSRLLYGNTYNTSAGVWYQGHLDALKLAGIMTKISRPLMNELRGYVMIMLERIGQ